MLGTKDKAVRPSRPGLYSSANADLAAPFNTKPSQASRQTTNAMDQQLRGMAPPLGMPKVAAPSAPAAAGPITQMSQAAAANYAASPNRVPTIPSTMPQPAQQPPAAPATPRAYAEPEIPANVLQRFAQLQSPNMGIRPQGMDYGAPLPTQQGPANPLAGMRVSDTSAPDIKRIDGGSSPLFTNIDPAQAVQEMRGGTVNTLPASSFNGRGGPVSALADQQAQGPSVGIIRNSDAGAQGGLQKQIQDFMRAMQGQLGRGRAGRNTMSELTKQFQAMTGAQQGAERLGADQENNAASLALRQQELAQQTATNQQRTALDQQRLALEVPGAAGQQLQNEQAQMMADLTRKAIGGDQEALKQLQALQGKDPKNPQVGLLQELMKAWAQGSASGVGNGMPLATMLQEAGPILQMALGGQGVTTSARQAFVEGQTYIDASGNRAKFVGGQWVEVR